MATVLQTSHLAATADDMRLRVVEVDNIDASTPQQYTLSPEERARRDEMRQRIEAFSRTISSAVLQVSWFGCTATRREGRISGPLAKSTRI